MGTEHFSHTLQRGDFTEAKWQELSDAARGVRGMLDLTIEEESNSIAHISRGPQDDMANRLVPRKLFFRGVSEALEGRLYNRRPGAPQTRAGLLRFRVPFSGRFTTKLVDALLAQGTTDESPTNDDQPTTDVALAIAPRRSGASVDTD